LISKLKRYFQDIYFEMKKVSWPAKKELVGSTAVVIIFSIIVAIIIGILDYIYAHGLVALISR